MLSKGLLRVLLGLTNVLFFIVGGTALGIGIWFAMDKLYLGTVLQLNNIGSAAFLSITAGVFILILSFVGCSGAIFESRKILLGYIIVVSLVSIIYVTSGIVAAVFQGQLNSTIQSRLEQSLRLYYGNYAHSDGYKVTESWDYAQQVLKCCGVKNTTGYAIYRHTEFFTSQIESFFEKKKYVPESCCVYIDHLQQYRDVDGCQYSVIGPPADTDPHASGMNDNLYHEGCYDKIIYMAKDNIGILVACSFGFLIVLIAGIVLAVMLYRKLKDYDPSGRDNVPFHSVRTSAH